MRIYYIRNQNTTNCITNCTSNSSTKHPHTYTIHRKRHTKNRNTTCRINKDEVQNILNKIENNINSKQDQLYGSSFAYSVEDYTSGNVEELISITEKQVSEIKKKNKGKAKGKRR